MFCVATCKWLHVLCSRQLHVNGSLFCADCMICVTIYNGCMICAATCKWLHDLCICMCIRDRPFNLKGGGLWFFVSFRIFPDNTRVRIFFFPRKVRIRLFFSSSTKIRIFFPATLGIRIFFLEKNHNPPLSS